MNNTYHHRECNLKKQPLCSGKANEPTNSICTSKCLSHFKGFPPQTTRPASPHAVEGRIPSLGETHGRTCRAKARGNTEAEWCTGCCRPCRWPTTFLHGLQSHDYRSCRSPDSYLVSLHVKPKLIFHHPFFVSHDSPDRTCFFHKPAMARLLADRFLQDLVDSSVLFMAPFILAT